MFYNAQYGFRTEHSTEFATLELVDRVIIEIDKADTLINIFLDLSKAFNTIDHKILLEINYAKSDTLTVTTGVQHGSILAPLLFLVYINAIALSNKLFDFILYADDTSLSTILEIIFKSNNNMNISLNVNHNLANISDWLKLNKLSLNVKKW